MFGISSFIKNKLQKSSQHFQVALQVIDLSPRKIKRILETGYAMYRGGKEARNPLFLHIEPTGACNLKCQMCPRTESITREMRHMSYDLFTKILDSVNPIIVALVGFGEPMVNPQTLDMVRYAVKKGVTTRISSNATLLNKKKSREIIQAGLHQIWFSIDSPDQVNFAAIRVGAQLDQVVQGIKEFIDISKELKSKIVVTINFTIFKENVHEIARMIKFCHEHLGVIPTFARGYGYDIDVQKNRALQNTGQIQQYLQDGIDEAQKNQMDQVVGNLETIKEDLLNSLDGKGPCYFPYYVVAVSWDGKVTPCCLFYDYQMKLGDFNKKSFDEIWNGKAYQSFRMKLKTNRQDINICNTCNLNDISLHNIMHQISAVPGLNKLTKERYELINRNSLSHEKIQLSQKDQFIH